MSLIDAPGLFAAAAQWREQWINADVERALLASKGYDEIAASLQAASTALRRASELAKVEADKRWPPNERGKP